MTAIPSAYPPPPPRRRGLKVYAIIATFLLLMCFAAIFILIVMVSFMGAALGGSASDSPAQRVQAETVTDGGHERVAILPISGTIDAHMVEKVHNFCEYIKQDNKIKAVVIEVDSPGGTVTASDEIYHMLLQLKTSRKLVVSMRSLAASGGYYLSMAADKLYAEPTTLTGSIGVIWPSFQVTKLMDNIGVKPEFVKSDNAAEFKDAGSPFKEMTEQDRAYIKGILNNAHDKFASIVDTGRKGKLTLPVKEVAIGKIWTSDEAKKIGLIDEIAYTDEVCANVAKDAGISNPTVVRLKNRGGLFDILGAKTPFTGGKVEVHIDPSDLKESVSPSLEYRYEGVR